MRKHILIRVFAALGGVTLWMLGLCALAETFFRIPVTGRIGQLLDARTPLAVLVTLLLAILLCAFGVCSLMMLSSKRAAKRKGFVMQKGENGMIGVSVKSIEGLVQTCVKQHDVVASAEIAVVERRDGIVILLDIKEAAGVNIPLAVGALQKQIKQYVNTCTGVDVHEVRVMVENTEDNVVESPYTVEKPVVLTTAATAAELYHETLAAEAVAEAPAVESAPVEEIPAEETAAPETLATEEESVKEDAPAVQETISAPTVSIPVVPVAPIVPVMSEIIEEADDRPLHQRLFGAEEQPVFVPAPPELVIEPVVEEMAEENAAESVEEIAEEALAAEEIDANAVLEVVEAIAQEEAQTEADEAEYAMEEMADYDEETLGEQAVLDGISEEDGEEKTEE